MEGMPIFACVKLLRFIRTGKMVQKGADATCRGTRPQEPHSSVAAIRDRRLQLREIDGSAQQHPPGPAALYDSRILDNHSESSALLTGCWQSRHGSVCSAPKLFVCCSAHKEHPTSSSR